MKQQVVVKQQIKALKRRSQVMGEKLVKNQEPLSLLSCLPNSPISSRLGHQRRCLSYKQFETVCMINIVVGGLIQTKLANLANTEVKREVLVFLPIFPHYLCSYDKILF